MTTSGTHQGQFFGFPPTGKKISIPEIHILRIANGKVLEHWGVSNDLQMMQQLGMLPADASPQA